MLWPGGENPNDMSRVTYSPATMSTVRVPAAGRSTVWAVDNQRPCQTRTVYVPAGTSAIGSARPRDGRKVRGVEHQDVGFHLHMNVAQHPHVAGRVERDRPCGAGAVGAQIELAGNG